MYTIRIYLLGISAILGVPPRHLASPRLTASLGVPNLDLDVPTALGAGGGPCSDDSQFMLMGLINGLINGLIIMVF